MTYIFELTYRNTDAIKREAKIYTQGS